MRAADTILGKEDDDIEDDLLLDKETLNRTYSFCPGSLGCIGMKEAQTDQECPDGYS